MEFLQNLDIWIKIIIALAVTVATELNISWNEIGGVGTFSGAGQTIPFVIGLAMIVRILYVAMAYERAELPSSSRSSSVRGGPPPIPVRQVPMSYRPARSNISRPSRVQRRSR